MEIMYWSDIACPFCYIGATRLKRALTQLGLADTTPLDFKAYQLDPTLKATSDVKMAAHFAQAHGMTAEQASQRLAQIELAAAPDGLDLDYANAIPVNTMTAHRLIKYAKAAATPAQVDDLIQRLYQAYFSEGKSVADHAALQAIAAAVGLEVEAVAAVLNSDQYADEVQADIHAAANLGIRGVPFFVINQKYAISGAQPYEAFVAALKKVQAEEEAK